MKHEISMEDIIKEAEKEVQLICCTTGQAYVKTVDETNAVLLFSVDSDSFEQWFRHYCYTKFGNIITNGTHAQAQAHMKMLARQNKERFQLHKRIYAKKELFIMIWAEMTESI